MSETQEDATSVVDKRRGALCLGGLLPLQRAKTPQKAATPPRILEPDEVMHKVLLSRPHAGQLAAVLHPGLVIHPPRPTSTHSARFVAVLSC
jgi:hypothetical protein